MSKRVSSIRVVVDDRRMSGLSYLFSHRPLRPCRINTNSGSDAVNSDLLKGCELHVHIGGCFYVYDLLDIGRDVYRDVDWSPFQDAFEAAYGTRPDPVQLFDDALAHGDGALERLREHYVYTQVDGGDFGRFMAKFNFLICLNRFWRFALGRYGELVERVVERHRSEGLDYVEYRAMYMLGDTDPDGFVDFHRLNADAIAKASGDGMTARYLISVPRENPLVGYALVQRLLDESPELVETIIGLDLCNDEEGFPPGSARPLFERVALDNAAHPERSLEIAYHVGENFWDKSLESSVRWCHEAAELGARRLGHAIALGLDPAVAISRRPEAHSAEPVSERLDQIAYDLRYRHELAERGVVVDEGDLNREAERLRQSPGDGVSVNRDYSPERLEDIRRRQDFAIHRLTELGAVIESCPTSNLRIGGVPDAAHHPIHRFLAADVNLVVGADDPGIFDSPLAAEVDWGGRSVGNE